MKSTALLSLVCALTFFPACSPEDGDEKTVFTCRYDNKFAGPDCKEYIGSDWEDPAKRDADCGSGFVEENASVVEGACPDTVEDEGKNKPKKGVCHVGQGSATEYDLYSYEGDLGALQIACENHMQGTWEALIDENATLDIYETLPEAFTALQSTDKVEVSSQCADTDCLMQMIDDQETFDFTPLGVDPIGGFVFYPGGNVDPRAYAPSALALAEQGIFVSIVPMENYLALSGFMRADDVRTLHPNISRWFVGGHSMGGTMAARYASTDTGKSIDGVVIWASVADENYNISDSGLAVLSIHATLDVGNDPDQVKQYAHVLPEDTIYICIDGGDHSQFGYYTDDNPPATISREEQQKQIIQSTFQFIQNPSSLNSVDCGS